MADPKHTPAELRAQVLRMHPSQYEQGTQDPRWILNVGKCAGMLSVAADRIEELQAALHEIADFSEQFIGDDEDGDERMYKVNQIADTALALDREGEP